MRVAVCSAYGGPEVVEIREVRTPTPKPGEILIRTHATTVSAADVRVLASDFPKGFGLLGRLALGVTRPRQPILGTEVSGIVEAVGRNVTRFRPGDAVFAMTGSRFGCHAEAVCVPETGAIAGLPHGLDFEHAAALSFGGTTALYFLRDLGKIQSGERVLINGAAGAVGSAAVQIAKASGAHVTGVTSAGKAALVRALGADAVIDYATTDYTSSGEQWDIVLDAVGNATYAATRASLRERGRLLLLVASLGDMLKAPREAARNGHTVGVGTAPEQAEDLRTLKHMAETGTFRPLIDSRYPLSSIREAHARAGTGHKTGSVVIAPTSG